MVCLAPFERVEIHHNGNVYFCCPSWVSYKSIGNIFNDSLEKIWLSQRAWAFRNSVLSGKNSYCDIKHCPPYKSRAIVKKKQLLNMVGDFPRIFVICYDRTCNLYCRSCRNKERHFLASAVDRYRYSKVKSFQDSLIKSGILAKVEYLSIAGNGDPFASELYRQLIQSLQRLNRKPKLILRTNGLLFHEKNWQELLPCIDLPLYKVDISIDAAQEKTYRKLRRGGNFKELLKNLSFIKKLHDEGKINKLCAIFVVQQDNYKEIPDFIKLMEEFNFTEILFKRIANWGTFTKKDFYSIDVSNPQHPEYQELLRIFDLPIVNKENINKFNLF